MIENSNPFINRHHQERLMATLSPEKQDFARHVGAALFDKYRPLFGWLREDDFALVESWHVEGKRVTSNMTIIEANILGCFPVSDDMTHPSRVQKLDKPFRNWKNIFDDKNRDKFMVTVDGFDYDSRTGATYETLAGLTQINPHAHGDRVWATGEKDSLELPHRIGAMTFLRGGASPRLEVPHDTRDISFRPGIVIDTKVV